MATIPTYERRIAPGGDLPVARATSNVSAQSPIADAIGGIGRQLGGMADTMMKEAVQQQENNAAVDVSNVLSQADVYWQKEATEATKSWAVGGPDLGKTIGEKFDAWSSETEGKLASEKAKLYFKQHAASMKSKLQTGMFSYMERATTAKLNADSAAGEQADENVVFNDAGKFEEVYRRRMEPMLARTDLNEAEKIKAADAYRRKLSLSVERGQLERDPVTWYRERFGDFRKSVDTVTAGVAASGGAGGGGGFDAVMPRIFKHEGGYSASDGNTGKPVNFGINQGANPDIDVKNLTKEGAAKIYKERYWDKIGGDNLPPALQGTAMDAAVNQGPANAKKWIAESGGDPVKFNQLRRDHYEMLLQDPANRKFRNAWIGRLDSYEKDGGGGGAAPVTGATTVRGAPPVADNAPSTFKGMDWEQQSALRSAAESRLKQDESRMRAEADRVLRDEMAMNKDGIVGKKYTVEELVPAYGAEAPRVLAELEKSQLMGADIGALKTQSEAEIMGVLERSKPVPGAGYASADERQSVRIQAAQRILQAREADPAGYVVQTNESVRKQRLAIDNPQTPAEQRPAMVQQYVRESLAEQQRLGIRAPRILTPGQSDAIAKRAMSAARPEDSANLIAGLEAEYGKEFFPKVFAELVKEKKISGELLLIPNLPTQTAREAVSRLARVKESDLTAGIDAQAQKDVKDGVNAKLEEFARAVPMMNEQVVGTINSYETSLRKIAYSFVANGMSVTDAVKQANTMLLGHYQFEGFMRVPAHINMREIKRGAQFMLENDLGTIDTERDNSSTRDAKGQAAEWQDRVKAHAQWFPTDDDSGLTLFALGKDNVRYRVKRDGKPVIYSWEDLAGRVSTGKGRVSSGKVTDLTGGK